MEKFTESNAGQTRHLEAVRGDCPSAGSKWFHAGASDEAAALVLWLCNPWQQRLPLQSC